MSGILYQKSEPTFPKKQFQISNTDNVVVVDDESFQLNGTASSILRAKNDVPIKQCSVEGFGARAVFCCGSDSENSECCADSATLFRLSNLPTNGGNSQGDNLGALNISPLPTTETPQDSLFAPLSKASEQPPPVVAALAASMTQPSTSTSTSVLPSAVTAVLEMADSDGTGAKDLTITFGGNEDTLLVATEVPPLQLSSGPAALVTEPTASVSGSAAVQRPGGSAAADSGSSLNLSDESNTESAEYSQRLSRGAVVAVGVGLSLAGAGLVAMTVFIIARRRVYKKQEKRWREYMKDVQAPKGNTGSEGGLNSSVAPGTRAHASSSMSQTRGSAGIGLVRLGATATQLSISTTSTTYLRPEMEGPSPVSEYLRDMGWQEGSSLDVPSMDSRSYYSQDSLKIQDADGRGVATYRSDIESPSARSPGLKPTASWLGRHSIYEMP